MTMHDTFDIQSLRARMHLTRDADDFASTLRCERGTLREYHALKQFHYKSGRPGAVTGVFVLRHDAPSTVGRYLQRRDESAVVGVLLRSLPHLGSRMRDHATANRYRGFGQRGSAAMLNREVRTISRVVIDPRYRGLGLAVRLVREVLAQAETIYTEALAAMGRVHPFFERAGMTRYDAPPRIEHQRMIDALAAIDIEPTLLASLSRLHDALRERSEADRARLEHELRRWHRAAFRTERKAIASMSFNDLATAARDNLLAQPVYYLTRHEDFA